MLIGGAEGGRELAGAVLVAGKGATGVFGRLELFQGAGGVV